MKQKAPQQEMIDFGDYEPMQPPEITDKTRYVVGVSGGKDSSAVLLWMVRESGVDPEKIVATFADTGNEHEWTYEHVRKINNEIHPVEWLQPEMGFFDLAMKKRRFPSTKARFCTEALKIKPTEDYITCLRYYDLDPISVSGIRSDESEDRKGKLEWSMAGFAIIYPQWRPVIQWTIDDVFAIHNRHNFPLNPLYSVGAQRVGCWPCIFSQKSEIRNIAINFPPRIDQIRTAEERFDKELGRYSSFFPPSKIPKRFHSRVDKTGGTYPTIDDVVRWSLSGKGATGHWEDEPIQEGIGCKSGFCE